MNHESSAETKMMSTLVPIRGESDEEKKILVGRVLFLFRCIVEMG